MLHSTRLEAKAKFSLNEMISDKGLTADIVGISNDGEVLHLFICKIEEPHWNRFVTENQTYPFIMHNGWSGCWTWELPDCYKNHDELNDFSYVQCMLHYFDDEPHKCFGAVS